MTRRFQRVSCPGGDKSVDWRARARARSFRSFRSFIIASSPASNVFPVAPISPSPVSNRSVRSGGHAGRCLAIGASRALERWKRNADFHGDLRVPRAPRADVSPGRRNMKERLWQEVHNAMRVNTAAAKYQ